MESVNVSVKKTIKYCVCKKDYAWNHSACARECDKCYKSLLMI